MAAQDCIGSTNFTRGARFLSYLAVAVALAAVLPQNAHAVSTRVKLACAKDYYAHCSQHAPNSPGVRNCMRAVGNALSPKCVSALVADGEVAGKEVADARR